MSRAAHKVNHKTDTAAPVEDATQNQKADAALNKAAAVHKNAAMLAILFMRIAKHPAMGNLLYIVAIILVIGWFLGFFYWDATGLIHILLVLAIIALLLGLIRRA